MTEQFPIIEVPEAQADAPEAMGTKQKFWYYNTPPMKPLLFKRATPGTGEDWAEKIAEELCGLISIPHASYELAICNGERGCISPKFVPEGASLLHGNEILPVVSPNYPKSGSGSRNFYRISQHHIDLVCRMVKIVNPPYNLGLPEGIKTALQTFAGYLIFLMPGSETQIDIMKIGDLL